MKTSFLLPPHTGHVPYVRKIPQTLVLFRSLEEIARHVATGR